MRAKTVNEEVNFQKGRDPKEVMDVGGFDFKEIKDQTWGKGVQDWKDFLNSFNGKRISFVAQPDFDTPYVKAGKRIIKRVKDWGFNEGMYNHVWFFDADTKPHKQYYIDLDHKVYVVDEVNEEVHFERDQDPRRQMGIGDQGAQDMMKGIDAFTHFLYYANAEDMIQKAFGGWDHIRDKIKSHAQDEGYLSPNALMKFVRDLDKGNQRKLYDYIIQNHSDKW
jgi:hypothetical protein